MAIRVRSRHRPRRRRETAGRARARTSARATRWPSGLAAALAFLALVLLAAGLPPGGAAAQARRDVYERFDPVLVVGTDGTFHVYERMVVRFEGGPFRQGERTIPLARSSGIVIVSVREEFTDGTPPRTYHLMPGAGETSAPGRFAVARQGSNLRLTWGFPESTDQTRTFVLSYDALDALRSYPEETPPNQQVWWMPVGADLTRQTPVEQAVAMVVLPSAVNPAETVLATNELVEPATTRTQDGRTFVWKHGAFAPGASLEVRLQVPPLVDVPVPAWQAPDDRARQAAEQADARRKAASAVLAALALLLAVGGGVGSYILWYLHGRDPVGAVVPSFLTKPPDDLPPGAVGALLDERVDYRDVVATIVDLGRRGGLTISPMLPAGQQGLPDFLLTRQDGAPSGALDAAVLEALFGAGAQPGATATLSSLGQQYAAEFPAIRAALDRELMARGYFPRPPTATRQAWRGAAVGIAAASAAWAGVVVGSWLLPAVTWVSLLAAWNAASRSPAIARLTRRAGRYAYMMALMFAWGGVMYVTDGVWMLPAAVGLVLAGGCWRLAGAMPRKTQAGADAAAQWQAFRRYLADTKRFEKLDNARHIYHQYLPYATAFDLDQQWIAAFDAVWDPPPAPAWWEPRPYGPVIDAPTGSPDNIPQVVLRGASNVGRGTTWGGFNMDWSSPAGVQLASNLTATSLQSSSNDLATFLKVAVTVLQVGSAFAGGGRSGGSFGGGGGLFR